MTKHRRRRTSTAAARQRRRAPRRTRRPRGPRSEKKSVALLTRELNEALEQQAATSEVLRVIASSPGDLAPVFQAMLDNATRICDANFGGLYLRDGDEFRLSAMHNMPPALVQARRRMPFRPEIKTPMGRAIRTKQVVHVADLMADQSYLKREPPAIAAVELGGTRTLLVVPMLKEHELIGTINIFRQDVGLFTDKQIELVENFAAQAVIAIENTRLLNELRESLQQQTATADVLKVISRSTFDLQSVLNTLTGSAARLCNAYDAVILLREGAVLVFGAHSGPIPMGAEIGWPVSRGNVVGRSVVDCKTAHVHDVTSESDEFPEGQAIARRIGVRTLLSVPLLREKEAIGTLLLRRTEVRPFTQKQIELAKTFADQAVIAIENVRLFEAEQERTQELSETLERQTATSEVLQVISSSPGTLEPVFETILANATRICEAAFGSMLLVEGDEFRRVALHNAPREFAEFSEKTPRLAASNFAQTINAMRAVQIADMATENPDAPIAKYGGARTLVTVPMLKQNKLIGVIGIYRQEVRPFTDKQIELVSNFAKQAVIAIDNTRLLNELRESLQQQTATADVLKVISRTAFELQPIFDTLVENAVRLCEAERAFLFRFDGKLLRSVATYNVSPELREFVDKNPIAPG